MSDEQTQQTPDEWAAGLSDADKAQLKSIEQQRRLEARWAAEETAKIPAYRIKPPAEHTPEEHSRWVQELCAAGDRDREAKAAAENARLAELAAKSRRGY